MPTNSSCCCLPVCCHCDWTVFLCLNAAQGGVSLINGALWEGERGSLGTQRHTNMSGAPTVSTNPQTAKMKKDESFLGKLGGTLVRKKKSKEGGPFEVLFFLCLFYMMEDPHFSFSCSCFCPWCCSLRYGNILLWGITGSWFTDCSHDF